MKKTLMIILFAMICIGAMAQDSIMVKDTTKVVKIICETDSTIVKETPVVQETIHWMSIEEAEARCAEEPKMIFIDVYTDWCGWCKRMDKTTFANPVIAKYMNEHFYAVKLNAETADTITFLGQRYVGYVREDGKNGTHRLARTLLNGRMSYPSYLIMNEEMRPLQVIPGYQNERAFEPMIHFFGDKVYLEMSSEDFLKDFKSELEPEETPDQKQ